MALFGKSGGASGGLKAGFREMKWGDAPRKEMEVLDEVGEEKFCRLATDDLTWSGAPVDKIVYQYWTNRFSDVYIEIPPPLGGPHPPGPPGRLGPRRAAEQVHRGLPVAQQGDRARGERGALQPQPEHPRRDARDLEQLHQGEEGSRAGQAARARALTPTGRNPRKRSRSSPRSRRGASSRRPSSSTPPSCPCGRGSSARRARPAAPARAYGSSRRPPGGSRPRPARPGRTRGRDPGCRGA